MASIIKTNTFSTDNIIVSAMKQDARGGKRISINYRQDGETVPFTFQTPRMPTYGMSRWEDTTGGNDHRFSTTLLFTGAEEDARMKEFHKMMRDLDEFLLQLFERNATEWLRIPSHKVSRDLVENNFTHIISTPLDKKTLKPNGKPDMFKLKFNKNDKGEFMTSFFTKDKQPVFSSAIEEYFKMGSFTRALVQLTGLWIINGRYGATFRVSQMVVEPPNRIGKSYAFVDDSDEEESAAAGSSKSDE